MSSYLRPDEMSSESRIKKSNERDASLKKGVKTVVGIGSTLAGASALGSLSSRILPLLSEYIPPALAIKGISKISPNLGNFLKNGMGQGLDIKEGLKYVKDNLNESEKTRQEALGKFNQKLKKNSLTEGLQQDLDREYGKQPDQRNVLEQYSPELFQFLKENIQQGRSPLEAGALAQMHDKFKRIISRLEADHKTPFSSILQAIFGQGQVQKNQQQTQQKEPQMQNSGDQALIAAFDKILKM